MADVISRDLHANFCRLNGYRPPSSCPSRIEAGSAVPTHTPTPHHTSNVRLSLSLDGKAELVSSETSPLRFVAGRPAEDIKPPLAEPRPSSLQRSNSDQMPILPPISSITASLPAASSAIASLRAERARDRVRTHHLSRRSRDPLVWESCADPDSASVPRDELTTLAENESSGSAVAAITLLRNSSASASPRTTPHAAVLQPNGSKRNMAYQAGGSAQQNQHHQSKRVKLHRSQSSLGRLQNTAGSTAANDAKPSGKFTVAMMVSTNHNGGADSDKENWSPDEDGSVARRRNCASPVGLTNGWSRQANAATGVSSIGGLVDATTTNSSRMNASALLLPTGRQQRKAADQRPLQIFEDAAQPQQQEERRSPPVLSSTVPLADQVECFLRGGVISPSKRPDVDIVTGLLSLRHGN